LYELERATSQAPSFDALVQSLLSATAGACDARGVALAVAFDDSTELVQYIYDAQVPEQVSRVATRPGEGLLDSSMELGSVVLQDATSHTRYHQDIDGRYPFPADVMAAVRLEGAERTIGAIGVFAKVTSRLFDEADTAILRMIAANASTALQLFLAKEERERSARLTSIGKLLSQVIHDFKTPLTVISGYVQLLQTEPDPKRRVEHAQLALRQFDVLAAMQREVLEFARGDRATFVRRVYLNKFFSDARQELERQLQGTKVQLEMNIDRKVVARFDENRVSRALQNLIRNAIEAMGPQGGTLTIEAGLQGDDLVISVADTGPGIPDEIRGRLFQSFVTARKQGGTGLGLAIVKKTVDEHGGRVEVRSTAHGACFEMYLPQTNAPPSRRSPSKSLPPPPTH
jgi:signal transduction histidine kinase